MAPPSPTFGTVAKQPAAYLPLAMSVAALTLVLAVLTKNGFDYHPADEGLAAHLWQLLMAGQAPVILWFVIQWLLRAPRQALSVLALQVCAALAACAPVYLLHL